MKNRIKQVDDYFFSWYKLKKFLFQHMKFIEVQACHEAFYAGMQYERSNHVLDKKDSEKINCIEG